MIQLEMVVDAFGGCRGARRMRRVRKLTIGALGALVFGVVLTVDTVRAQSARDLAGTWTLVSSVVEQGGTKTEPYGPNAKGIMTVDANGRYVIVTMRAGLPKFASNSRATGTPAENTAIVGGSIALFGTLSVNEAEKAIILKIETSTFPNWDGTEQKWPFTITGDTLQWTVPAASGGGTATASWKRAN